MAGIGGGAAYDKARRVAKEMAIQLRDAGHDHSAMTLTDQEACGRSEMLIVERFGETSDDLELLSVETRLPAEATTTFRGSDGWTHFTKVRRLKEGGQGSGHMGR